MIQSTILPWASASAPSPWLPNSPRSPQSLTARTRALLTGYVDPAVELPNFIEALKAAGIDTVKAEVETQYDAWKATQGE